MTSKARLLIFGPSSHFSQKVVGRGDVGFLNSCAGSRFLACDGRTHPVGSESEDGFASLLDSESTVCAFMPPKGNLSLEFRTVHGGRLIS